VRGVVSRPAVSYGLTDNTKTNSVVHNVVLPTPVQANTYSAGVFAGGGIQVGCSFEASKLPGRCAKHQQSQHRKAKRWCSSFSQTNQAGQRFVSRLPQASGVRGFCVSGSFRAKLEAVRLLWTYLPLALFPPPFSDTLLSFLSPRSTSPWWRSGTCRSPPIPLRCGPWVGASGGSITHSAQYRVSSRQAAPLLINLSTRFSATRKCATKKNPETTCHIYIDIYYN